MTFGLSTIGQITLTVKDTVRAVEFYRDRLGIPFVFQAPNAAFFDCDGMRLVLGPGEGTSVVYFKVDEMQNAFETLKSRQVVFDREPHLVARMPDHDLWMAFFRDPDGNVLGLMCEQKR